MTGDPLPPLNWLKAFEASARHLSFTGAARELNMTQSAVSQQIKSLETYLKRQLFLRQSKSLQLTDVGLNYLPTVQEAFATLTAGTRALRSADRGTVLTIQSNLAFSAFWLAPRLGDLLNQHPWLTLNIIPKLWDIDPLPTSADVEIKFGRELTGEGLTRLSNDTCFPVCSPPLVKAGAHWSTSALFDCSGMLANWETWLKDQSEELPANQTVNFGATFVISLGAAQAGAGLALAHETIADDLLQKGALVRAFDHAIPMREAYYHLAPAKHMETPASRAFTAWLFDAFHK